jgi:hypothetical protein
MKTGVVENNEESGDEKKTWSHSGLRPVSGTVNDSDKNRTV